MERIAIRLITQLLTEGGSPAEVASVDWIPLMTGNERFETKTRTILEGLLGYKHTFGWRCKVVDGGIIAGSRLVTAMLVGYPRSAKEFVAMMHSYVSGSSELNDVAARHACILGLMRTYVLLQKYADKDCWGFPLGLATEYIPKWVTMLTFPLTNATASEQASLMSGFISALKVFGEIENFGQMLRKAVVYNQRAATIGLEQFVDSYTIKLNNQLDRTERLERLHPAPAGEVAEPFPML